MAAAQQLYRLMAYKDEYEVARLYTDDTFRRRLMEQFEGEFELRFNLAPPAFSKRDPVTGHLIKREFGPWMMKAFELLARLRLLRGTALDPFGYTRERRQERADIDDYWNLLQTVMADLAEDNYAVALELANWPARLRGFGHVKDRNREQLQARKAQLLRQLRSGEEPGSVNVVNVA